VVLKQNRLRVMLLFLAKTDSINIENFDAHLLYVADGLTIELAIKIV